MPLHTDLQIRQQGFVTVVTLNRAPHNFVDAALMQSLAETLQKLDQQDHCRVIVLAAAGRSFCAGADFSVGQGGAIRNDLAHFYAQAMRLFHSRKPIVAAVHGAAVGGGLGLALVADFRVTCQEARFSANFTRLGFHPGFGLSTTLPRLIGEQKAALLFYTGRRIGGAEAVAMGLADELVPQGDVLDRAIALAQEMAESAPLAVQSIRATLRRDLAERVTAVNQREMAEQIRQFQSDDFREGIAATAQRRAPVFTGR